MTCPRSHAIIWWTLAITRAGYRFGCRARSCSVTIERQFLPLKLVELPRHAAIFTVFHFHSSDFSAHLLLNNFTALTFSVDDTQITGGKPRAINVGVLSRFDDALGHSDTTREMVD